MSNQWAQDYQRDGFVVAHELFTPQECDALKQEGQRVLREHAKPGRTVFVGVAAASPVFHRLASDERIVAILREIMPQGVMFMSDKFVFKSGEQRFPTPWHQDVAYWQNTRPKLSVWIPLDDVSEENGTLKVLPGSHRRQLQHGGGKGGETNDEFVNVITELPQNAPGEIVCEMKRGGALFFSDHLAHASCANTSGQDRYVIISTYHAPAPDEPFDLGFAARHVIVPSPV
jgi:ectoine hydroxylase-related dioxygenase (phytanoyl-CoA dioxygenase family)